MNVVVLLALGCTPDSEKVGELDTEGASTGTDAEDASATASGTGGGTQTTSTTDASTSDTDSASGSGDPETTGGALVDACEMPLGPELWPPDEDSCPFELSRPCDDVVFTRTDEGGPDLVVEDPNAAFCMLDWLDSDGVVALTLVREDPDSILYVRADMWLFDDGTAVVDVDGYEDKGNLGALPQRFMRPDPAQFEGCSALGPAQETYDCLWWWENAACIGTPADCDQALP